MLGRTRLAVLLALAVASSGAGCGEPAGGGDPDAGLDADSAAEPDGESADAGPDSAEPDAELDEPDAGRDDAEAEPAADPSAAGPFAFTTVGDEVLRGSRRTPVSAIVPDLPGGGPAPLVLFLPGFQMRSAWYLPLLERLASHGFLVVRADPPASLFDASHPEMALDAAAVLDWALEPAGPLAGRVEAGRLAASGHSAGGKVATMLAAADPRVRALFLLDPVNGSGPFGYSASQPDIVPELVLPLAIPIGLVGETTDTVGRLGGQPCAPADQNFLTFYDAAEASPWVASWEVLGADHVDFVFDRSDCGLPCTLCVEGSASPEAVHAAVETLAVAFFRLHFLGERAMEPWLLSDLAPDGLVTQHRP